MLPIDMRDGCYYYPYLTDLGKSIFFPLHLGKWGSERVGDLLKVAQAAAGKENSKPGSLAKEPMFFLPTVSLACCFKNGNVCDLLKL